MRTTGLLIVIALLLCGCPQGTTGPSNAEIDADINTMRDEYLETMKAEIADLRPQNFVLKDRASEEAYKRDMQRLNKPLLDAWPKAVEDTRDDLRKIAASNWSLAKADRHKLLRNRALERHRELTK